MKIPENNIHIDCTHLPIQIKDPQLKENNIYIYTPYIKFVSFSLISDILTLTK